ADGAHQCPELRVLEGEIDHAFDDAAEALPSGRMVVVKLLFEPIDQPGEAAVEDGEVEVFLALKIDVECSLAYAGGGSDVVEADLMEWLSGEEVGGRRQDHCPFFIVR